MNGRCKVGNKWAKPHLYVGKGITVCDRWKDFLFFLEDMGEAPDGHSIDRINGNKGYEPGNCRWATPKIQANNMSSNHVIEYKGQSQTLQTWADQIGIRSNTLLYRLKRGWSVERAMESPLLRSIKT
jgi:hypothetical protein